MIRLRYGAATDPGVVRSVNEDNLLATDGLYAVADGMGGHVYGEVASEVAVEALQSGEFEGLIDGVRLANRAVWQRSRDDASLRGMGTTLCAIALIQDAEGNEVLQVANVGDSRAYRFRQNELEQLTEDHSLVAELEREGRITAEEAKVHPQRNIVTRVLGVEPDVNVDCKIVDPYAGDRYLICSDGLFNEVPEDEIARVLRQQRDPDEATKDLVRMARDAGGRDNITVIVVDVTEDGGKSEAASLNLAADPPQTTVRRLDETSVGTSAGASRSGSASTDGSPSPPATGDADGHHGRRFTWRVALFALAVLAVVAGAIYATWWFGRNTYYVGEQDDEVTIFRGRPGGVLWLDPTVEEETGLGLDDISRADQDDIEEGQQFSALGKAKAYVENLEDRRAEETGATTTTTTAAPATTVPPTSAPPTTTTP